MLQAKTLTHVCMDFFVLFIDVLQALSAKQTVGAQ